MNRYVSDEDAVEALLQIAGLKPPGEEIAAMKRDYAERRRLADLLYDLEGSDQDLPSLPFEVDKLRSDWPC